MTRRSQAVELVSGAGIAAALTMATIIYVGRLLGPAEYADFSAGLAVVYLVALVLSPVTATVARVVARSGSFATIRPLLLRKMAWWLAGALLITAPLLVPVSRSLNLRSPATLFLAVVTALVYALLSVDRGVLQGLFRFREYNFNIVVEAVVRAVIIAVLGPRFPHAGFAMAAWALATVISEAWLASRLSRRGASAAVAEDEWRAFAGLLRPIVLLMLSIAVFQNTDMLAVKRWLTAQDAGAYGAASALARGFGVLFVPLYVLAGPVLTERHARGGGVLSTTLRFCLGFLALSILPLLVLAFWREPLVRTLYGSGFVNAAFVILPLGVITVMTYTTLMLVQAPLTTGDYRFAPALAGAALLQVALLAAFHDTYAQILASLYAAQGIALIAVAALVIRRQRAA